MKKILILILLTTNLFGCNKKSDVESETETTSSSLKVKTDSIIAAVTPTFQQFTYNDESTGLSITYNLFIPTNYDESQTYPLITFVGDASTVGSDATTPLTQGLGGVVWATDAEQEKHPSFVLVPQYPEIILDDHGSFKKTEYVELTKRLIDYVSKQYSVDKNRLYGTGQSMGCMTMLILASEYPDFFAAEYFVSGQWDINALQNLQTQTFFYIAAGGDDRASGGQVEVMNMLSTKGVSYSSSDMWDAQWDDSKFDGAVKTMLAENNTKNFPLFITGSVMEDSELVNMNSEHMSSFNYGYNIESIRDWLYQQHK